MFPEVSVVCGNILSLAHNAIVSPANSYGYMDGGIDELYVQYFGLQIQDRVQDAISRRQEGYLPVGASLVVKTGHPKIPYLVVSPTMIIPEPVPPSNCFFAMAATLSTASRIAAITHLFCPGLATGMGKSPLILPQKKWQMPIESGRSEMTLRWQNDKGRRTTRYGGRSYAAAGSDRMAKNSEQRGIRTDVDETE